MPSQSTSVFVPHVPGILALVPLVELLPCIALEVVEVAFTVAISVVLAKFQVRFEIIEDLSYTGVGFKRHFGHDGSY
jgi:hypothetical protein